MRGGVLALVLCLAAASASAQSADTETGEPGEGNGATSEDEGSGATSEDEAEGGTASDLLPPELAPTLSLAVEPDSGVMTGDLVTLVITAEAHEGDDVAVPRQELAPFEVLDSSAEQNGSTFVFRIELLALEPGEHEVGPVRLRVVTSDGTLGSAETAPVSITVGSVLGNEPDAQPKPPTDPVEVIEEDYTLAWIGGGLLGMLLLALIMFFVTRWWLGRDKPEPPPPPPRPPWEVAMEELGALRGSVDQDAEAKRLTRWVDALSDTLRVYLGARYGFEGIESTTDEAVAFIRRKKPKGITAEQVAGILSDCDLVKFAKATPERERCIALLEAAEGIVKATTARLGGEVVTDVPGVPPKEAEESE